MQMSRVCEAIFVCCAVLLFVYSFVVFGTVFIPGFVADFLERFYSCLLPVLRNILSACEVCNAMRCSQSRQWFLIG